MPFIPQRKNKQIKKEMMERVRIGRTGVNCLPSAFMPVRRYRRDLND